MHRRPADKKERGATTRGAVTRGTGLLRAIRGGLLAGAREHRAGARERARVARAKGLEVGQGDRGGDNMRVGQRAQQRASDENRSTYSSLHGRVLIEERPKFDLFAAESISFLYNAEKRLTRCVEFSKSNCEFPFVFYLMKHNFHTLMPEIVTD